MKQGIIKIIHLENGCGGDCIFALVADYNNREEVCGHDVKFKCDKCGKEIYERELDDDD